MLHELALEFFGIGHHRAELQAVERLALEPHAFLAEDDRSSVVELDGDGDGQHDRCGDEDGSGRSDDVEEPLAEGAGAVGRRTFDVHQRNAGHRTHHHAARGDVGQRWDDDRLGVDVFEFDGEMVEVVGPGEGSLRENHCCCARILDRFQGVSGAPVDGEAARCLVTGSLAHEDAHGLVPEPLVALEDRDQVGHVVGVTGDERLGHVSAR